MFTDQQSRLIAQFLCDATHNILWELHRDAINRAQSNYRLVTRVGEGKSTNCAIRGDGNQIVITYGLKMVRSKSSMVQAYSWLTSREIRVRRFFAGKHTLPNLLAHTVCHEFAHLIQCAEGSRAFGSVHNPDFYRILHRLHDDGCAALVLEFLLECSAGKGIKLCWSDNEDNLDREIDKLLPSREISSLLPSVATRCKSSSDLDFRIGEPVFFIHSTRGRIDSRIVRVNRKTVSLDNGWRVSPNVLHHIKTSGEATNYMPMAPLENATDRTHPVMSFEVDDRAVFISPSSERIHGTIKRINVKTYTLIPDNPKRPGQYWRIAKNSPNLSKEV